MKKSVYFIPIIISILAVMAVHYAAENYFNDRYANWEEIGTVGDYYGGLLNPIFGIISMVLIVITLRQNHRMIEFQRVEIETSNSHLEQRANMELIMLIANSITKANSEDHALLEVAADRLAKVGLENGMKEDSIELARVLYSICPKGTFYVDPGGRGIDLCTERLRTVANDFIKSNFLQGEKKNAINDWLSEIIKKVTNDVKETDDLLKVHTNKK